LGDDGEGGSATDEVDAGDGGVAEGVGTDEGRNGREGFVDKRRSGLVENGDGDGDVLVADGKNDAPGLRNDGLLGGLRLVEKPHAGGGGESVVGATESVQGEGGENLVEVVATEAGATDGVHNRVIASGDGNERGIERATTEVVDEDGSAARVEGAGVTVRVLKSGGGWLVDEPFDRDSGAGKRGHGDESLRVVRVRGNTENHLNR